MDIEQLKQEYPELMNFLYNTSNDRSYLKESSPVGFRPRTTKPTVTLGENSFVYYNSTSKMLEGESFYTNCTFSSAIRPSFFENKVKREIERKIRNHVIVTKISFIRTLKKSYLLK